MAGIRSIGRFFMFIVGGLVAIIVGSFMIRGTMHMWDNPEKEDDNDKFLISAKTTTVSIVILTCS